MRASLVLMLVTLVLAGCSAAQKPQRTGDEWAFDGEAHDLDGDPDAAESRWRKEIAANSWSDEQDMLDRDKLLTDDPPGPPSKYGKVASSSGRVATRSGGGASNPCDVATSPGEDADPAAPPKTFWDRFQAGADTFGKATFAALTVVVTLGMMVAPYLLL